MAHFTPIPRAKRRHSERAFSLIETVMVIAIIGVVAAIAVPRMQGAAERATSTSQGATVRTIQRAIDLYTAEHGGLSPAQDESGAIDPSSDNFIARLTGRTNEFGAIDDAGIFGPYLRGWPANVTRRSGVVSIDGEVPAKDDGGWTFASDTGVLGVYAGGAIDPGDLGAAEAGGDIGSISHGGGKGSMGQGSVAEATSP